MHDTYKIFILEDKYIMWCKKCARLLSCKLTGTRKVHDSDLQNQLCKKLAHLARDVQGGAKFFAWVLAFLS